MNYCNFSVVLVVVSLLQGYTCFIRCWVDVHFLRSKGKGGEIAALIGGLKGDDLEKL